MYTKRLLFLLGIVILILFNCSDITVDKDTQICLQPFKGFSKTHLNEVKQAIEKYYRFKVAVLDEIELPENAFTTKRTPRYRADTLIRYLKTIKPDNYDYIIGLTDKDISITKYTGEGTNKKIKEPEWKYCDFGIFGLGYRPGPSCLISTFRLYSSNANDEKMLSRLRKITVHELGHNLRLPHCPNKDCFMQDACQKMSTIDNAKEYLCYTCKSKLGIK